MTRSLAELGTISKGAVRDQLQRERTYFRESTGKHPVPGAEWDAGKNRRWRSPDRVALVRPSHAEEVDGIIRQRKGDAGVNQHMLGMAYGLGGSVLGGSAGLLVGRRIGGPLGGQLGAGLGGALGFGTGSVAQSMRTQGIERHNYRRRAEALKGKGHMAVYSRRDFDPWGSQALDMPVARAGGRPIRDF
jgi:hypothetical protein